MRYHLITANFSIYNFDQLQEEIKEEGYILWKNSNNQKYEAGDKVYIYYSDLPDGTSRILLEATVLEADKYNEDTYMYSEKEKIKGFKLHEFRPIAIEDKEKYNRKNLVYKKIEGIMGQRYLDSNSELIKELEKETKGKNYDREFAKLKEKFEIKECFFKGKIPGEHSSFIKQNGYNYLEQHHIIEQNKRKEIKDIDCEENLIDLCPLCHRKIHYGKIEDKIKMVQYLYKERNKHKKLDKILEDIPNIKGHEFKYILDLYFFKNERIYLSDEILVEKLNLSPEIKSIINSLYIEDKS